MSTKKFKEGLYVGKFIAYHKGHQNCINQFTKQCDKLKIVICTRKNDRVPASFRKKWLEKDLKLNIFKEIHHPEKIELFHYDEDGMPLYPNGLVQWCNDIKNLVGRVDVMFGNEEYVKDCSQIFQSEFLIPDINRNFLNVSSTKIVEGKLKYYDFLATVSQSYFNKVVMILGAEQMGKSTLIKNLSKHYNSGIIEEYGRDYFENEILKEGLHGLSNWSIKEFENLSLFFNDKLKSKLDTPQKIIFCDVSSIMTEIYANLYIRQTSNLLQNIIKSEKSDLIFLLKDNKNIINENKIQNHSEDNLNKDSNEYLRKLDIQGKKLVCRDFFYNYLKHSLEFFEKPFTEVNSIKGNHEKAFDSIIKEINSSFNL